MHVCTRTAGNAIVGSSACGFWLAEDGKLGSIVAAKSRLGKVEVCCRTWLCTRSCNFFGMEILPGNSSGIACRLNDETNGWMVSIKPELQARTAYY